MAGRETASWAPCLAAALAACLFLLLLPGTLCQEQTVQRCLSGNGSEERHGVNVTLTCEEGQAVSVEEASLSRNTVLCGRTAGDCSERLGVFSQCDGRRTCTLLLRKTYTRHCGYATYLRVIFACVTEIHVGESKSTDDPSPLRLTPETQGGQANVPSFPPRTTAPYLGPRTQPTNSPDDTALIVGCAVAVVITTIVLIVAIVLVVRRLFSSGGVEGGGEKQGGIPGILGCGGLGCLRQQPYPLTPSQATPTTSGTLESRLTPIGAPADPSLVDPAPNTAASVPVTIATIAMSHVTPTQVPHQQQGQMPHQQGQMPHQQPGQMPHQQQGQMAHQQGQMAHQQGQMPHQQPGQMPHQQQGQMAHQQGQMAHQQGQMPHQQQGQMPHQQQGQMPHQQQGQMPHQQGQMAHQQQGQMPHQQGQMAHQQGQMPHQQQGQMPHQQGQMPHQQGQMPHQQGQMPHQQGQMPHQQGQMPHQQGQMPHQQVGQHRQQAASAPRMAGSPSRFDAIGLPNTETTTNC